MKKSFKKLGFFSLAASGVLLGSMNATDLETYATLQKPSHVFGNYAEKEKEKEEGSKKEVPTGFTNGSGKSNSGSTPTPQQQAQTTATSDKTEATTLENTATTDNTTAAADKAYESSTYDSTVSGAAQKVETDNTAVQTAEQALKSAVEKVQADANATDFNETTFKTDQAAEQTAEKALQQAESKLNTDQQTLNTALQDQTKTPTPSTPPTKEEPKHTASSGTPSSTTPPAKKDETSGGTSGNTVASQLTKDITMVNNLKSVSVSGMNTTLSGVETMSQQSATIGNLLNSSTDLSSVIPNAQGLNSAFSTLESAQNTLKGYLNSSSATIGQLTNGSNAVVGALDKAINQVDMALADLVTADTQKTQAVTLAAASDSTTTTTDAINFLNALKSNLMAQKDAFMNVHKNIQTAVAQAQATYTPSVINTNNYGQMYGVDAMAGYKWFFGKTKRFGFRSYGYYSYNHANLSFVGSQLGIMEGASQVNNFTYGVGFDALYNFYESKESYNTAGLFVGFGLGGDSFIVQGESYLKSQMQICNNTAGCSASMNTSYFQMPVEFGFRSNFSKHSGIEVGFKLPLFTNQFYKERGVDGSVDVFYKRNFSIYFNYMINF
ncbi:outer membrane beta-barrel protein [Helicobacter pylori]|uniref:outer membrane protein n=1 Tax=Helicobacter pylori TaxID=210 RepID=UPI00042ED5FE|nr:outer membrane beta-barrel protein [Helicobacter pylori]AHN34150.1 membrane protein [Helicobacter pylori oki102]WRE04955.1 outer membrane beta-barrel protein [Helicobacter pylori]